jgi:hypothetical protein
MSSHRAGLRRPTPSLCAASFQVQPLEPRRLLSASLDRYGTVRADANDMAFDAGGTLHRVWRDYDSNALKYAARGPDLTWGGVTTIDTTPVGGQMSIAIDPLTRRPGVSYYDRINADLKYASLGPTGAWNKVTVDAAGFVGEYSSLVFMKNTSKPYVSYYDRTNGDLKFAWQPFPGLWSTTTLDSAGDVGAYSSIAQGGRGGINIAYADNTTRQLRFASQELTGTWVKSVVDASLPAGVRDISLMAGPGNVQMMAYHDVGNKRLKTAVQIAPGVWYFFQLASNTDTGSFASVYTDHNDVARVLHFDRYTNIISSDQFGVGVTAPDTKYIASPGDYLNVAVNPVNRTMFFNKVDPESRLLRTSTTNFDHVKGTTAGQRIAHWETIGGSGHDEADMNVGWSIKTVGWSGYVNTRVAQLRNLGMQRMFLHNPFGTSQNDTEFQFDQFIHAQNRGLNWLTNGFAEAWKPVTDAGIEVIAYIGKLPGDPDFTSLNMKDFLVRVWRSVEPLLKAGMSIGLDSINGVLDHSREFLVAKMLRDNGVKVYSENRPAAGATWWHDFGGVYYNRGFLSSQPELGPHNYWTAPNSMLRGDILRWTSDPPPGMGFYDLGWRSPEVIKILRDGHTAATDITAVVREGYSLNRLLALADGRPVPTHGNTGLFSHSAIEARASIRDVDSLATNAVSNVLA